MKEQKKYEIICEIGEIGTRKQKWNGKVRTESLQLRLIRWNENKKPILDLRWWYVDLNGEHPMKGVTFDPSFSQELMNALKYEKTL